MSCVGITKLIKRLYPKYSYRRLKIPKSVVSGGDTKRVACRKGKKLDSDLCKWASDHGAVPPKNPEAECIVDWLRVNGLVGASTLTQVEVRSTQMCIYTQLDMLCNADSASPVVVEIKRGCAYRECKTPEDVSPLLIHQTQVMLGQWLYNNGENKPEHHSEHALLLYLDVSKEEQHQVIPYATESLIPFLVDGAAGTIPQGLVNQRVLGLLSTRARRKIAYRSKRSKTRRKRTTKTKKKRKKRKSAAASGPKKKKKKRPGSF